MSQSITETGLPTRAGSGRRWLTIARIGVALIVLAMVVVALVIYAKPQFGGLVGTWFLPIITSGVLLGGIVVLVAAWKLHERNNWRGKFLMLWALIALTSPLFGIMFLLPWGVLALTLPVVISILMKYSRTLA
jgi:hypothetical protein